MTDNEVVLFIGGHQTGDHTKIVSKTMKYRILNDNCLGRKLRGVKEIAVGCLRSALIVADRYVQCPECSNIWEAENESEIARCPECETLLEIQRRESSE